MNNPNHFVGAIQESSLFVGFSRTFSGGASPSPTLVVGTSRVAVYGYPRFRAWASIRINGIHITDSVLCDVILSLG